MNLIYNIYLYKYHNIHITHAILYYYRHNVVIVRQLIFLFSNKIYVLYFRSGAFTTKGNEEIYNIGQYRCSTAGLNFRVYRSRPHCGCAPEVHLRDTVKWQTAMPEITNENYGVSSDIYDQIQYVVQDDIIYTIWCLDVSKNILRNFWNGTNEQWSIRIVIVLS